MKRSFAILFGIIFSLSLHAQDSTSSTPYRIAIFAPLYLDSAFDATNEYRYAKNTFPKFINPGLEFYEGAQMALDSMELEGVKLEIFVYDTRSGKETLEQQLEKSAQQKVNLIIAHCSGNEVRSFSEAALERNIPVINTTIPHDGGTNSNPYFVVLNPTLKTQIEGIYRYVQKYYSLNPVIVFRKKGVNEDQIRAILDDYSKNAMGSQVKLKYVDLIDSFTLSQLRTHLDSNKHSVIIAGSLDIHFGRRLAVHLASIGKHYPITLVGMPTWDGIRDLSRPEFKGIEIVFSNPFYNAKTDKVSTGITNYFASVMYSRPSDMVFRGYEVTWKFAKLLLQYGKDLSSNLGNKQNNVFTDFDIQPVLTKANPTLQYFENKRLYFVKWSDGIVKSVVSQ